MILDTLRLRALVLPMVLAAGAAFPAWIATSPAANPDKTPFQVGERLTYDAKVNAMKAGKATISVEGLETVRGVPTFHTIFDLRGRVLFKKFANHYESWFDTTNLVTLRHVQKTDDADKSYEFYPAQKMYVKNGDGIENPSVTMPLDESSFLYYLRSLPLEIGKTYTVDRYYYAAKNPITVTVLRKERIKVPAGEFDAYVLKPVIKSNGLFSVKSDAEVWIADDRAHTILKLKSKLPLGTLYLELRSIEQPG
ncbi:MAG TPA: DUF3108 domain-containing protein [Gemmatimonadaceae bacterium]|nr:DUF3108 domain-containing protein [Gemmatimonadaceae bacterium]